MTEGEQKAHQAHETFDIPIKGSETKQIMVTFDDRLDRDVILSFLVRGFHSLYRSRDELTLASELEKVSPRKSHGQRRSDRERMDIAEQQLHDKRASIERAIGLFEGRRQGYVRVVADEENTITEFNVVIENNNEG